MQGLLNVISDQEMEMINDSAINILENIGMKIESDIILKKLKSEGAIVDETKQRARIPAKVFKRLLKKNYTDLGNDELTPPNENDLAVWGSHPFIQTWPDCKLHSATRKDLQEVLQGVHMLAEIKNIAPPVAIADTNPMLEPIEALAMTMSTTNKHISGAEIFAPEQMKYGLEMGEIYSGNSNDTRFIGGCEYFTSPLILSERSARCIVERTRLGAKTNFGTMATSGLNAPGTIAGTVVLGLAEILGGQIIGACLNPDVQHGAIACTGVADMSTMACRFSTPETVLQDVSLYQICRRLYGLRITIAEHFIDAPKPGIQATFEKTYRFCSCASFTTNILLNNGLINGGNAFSPVQCILDIETNRALLRLYKGYEINIETLAKEVISEEAIKDAPDFLTSKHTLDNFRNNFWFPNLFLPNKKESGKNDKSVLEHACDKWNNAVNSYEPPDIPQEKLQAVKDVVKRAQAEFCC